MLWKFLFRGMGNRCISFPGFSMMWKFLFHVRQIRAYVSGFSGNSFQGVEIPFSRDGKRDGVGAVGRAAVRGGSAGSFRARTCAPGRGCV